MNLKKMTLKINGADRMFICDPEKDTLADVIRRLGLTGTKVGCGTGVCGACSVILDGKVVRSCMRKISRKEPTGLSHRLHFSFGHMFPSEYPSNKMLPK